MSFELMVLIDQYLNEFKSREARERPFTYEEVINMLLDLRNTANFIHQMEGTNAG